MADPCGYEGCTRSSWKSSGFCRNHHPHRCIAINVNTFNGGQQCHNINKGPAMLCWKHKQ